MAATTTYSTMVSWAKIVLPVLALGLLSMLFLFAERPDPEDAIFFAEADVTELARQQRLSGARFAGTLSDGREVLFSAASAAPQATQPNLIEAEDVSLRVELAPADFAVLSAQRAELDLNEQMARIRGGIDLWRSNGMQLTAQSLDVALDELYAQSPAPVTARGRGMVINAGAMEVLERDGAQLIRFTQGVQMLYQPN